MFKARPVIVDVVLSGFVKFCDLLALFLLCRPLFFISGIHILNLEDKIGGVFDAVFSDILRYILLIV